MKKYFSVLTLILLTFSFSQKQTLTLADATLGYWKGLYPETLQGLRWASHQTQYGFVSNNELIYFDANTGQESSKLSLARLQNAYPQIQRFPWKFEGDGEVFIFNNGNAYVYYYPKTGDTFSIDYHEKAENPDFSQQAKAVAYTLENNLYIASKDDSKKAITSFSDKNIVAGQAIARSEYGITKGTFWSPNGNFLAFYQKDESNVSDYPLVDITTYPATEMPIKYPMAGQGSEVASVGIYDVKKDKTLYLKIDTKDNHYLTNLTWTPDEKYVLIAELNRATTAYELNRYDINTGEKVNTIMSESNPIWVEPEHDAYFLPKANDTFIWMSEKSGFMNLYLYKTTGKFVKQLTQFKWVVKDVLGFDKNGENVFISGTGEDARNTYTYKVNITSGDVTQLTPQEGSHTSQLSHDGKYLIDAYSSLTTPGETQLINTQTGEIKSLQKSKNPLENYKVGTQEFVDLKANDGTVLHGLLTKPANFDPNKKYPVLVYVYGGPHAQMVTNSYLGGASLWLPAFASLNDYIVFTLDNRGSANRGFAFESGIHRQLGELEMQDQMVGIDYLKSLPYVNANRMAINGWSFGGFMTSSLMLRHPGTFTTAVAGGPVIDWKYYEVMYGERYMDTPLENPQGYEKARVSNYIKNLEGRLMIITGSVDPVVVPQHSMSLLKAAVDNNVQIDFFSYPMHEHNVGGMDRINLIEKMANYIVEHNQ